MQLSSFKNLHGFLQNVLQFIIFFSVLAILYLSAKDQTCQDLFWSKETQKTISQSKWSSMSIQNSRIWWTVCPCLRWKNLRYLCLIPIEYFKHGSFTLQNCELTSLSSFRWYFMCKLQNVTVLPNWFSEFSQFFLKKAIFSIRLQDNHQIQIELHLIKSW